MMLAIDFENLEPCQICGDNTFRYGHAVRYRNIAGVDIYESIHCKKCSRIHPVMNRLVALKIIGIHGSTEQSLGYIVVDGDAELTQELFKKIFIDLEIHSIKCLNDIYTIVGINSSEHTVEYILCMVEDVT